MEYAPVINNKGNSAAIRGSMLQNLGFIYLILQTQNKGMKKSKLTLLYTMSFSGLTMVSVTMLTCRRTESIIRYENLFGSRMPDMW